MRSAAAAFAWEFRARHRWGLAALAAAVIVLAILKIVVFAIHNRIDFDNEQTFAFVVIIPLTGAFFYFLGVFSFGLSGDVVARESMYPKRLFTLPVSSTALAAWPMIYGCAAGIALWFTMRAVGSWPSSVYMPSVWPGLLAGTMLAWTQAVTWLAYPVRGMRVITAALLLTAIDVVVMTAYELRIREGVMLTVLAPSIPLAFLVARAAVKRARRGEVPEWRLFSRASRGGGRTNGRFDSPRHAQVWFEWRQHGRSLPMLVALLLPFELALMFLFPDTPVIIVETVVLALLSPPLMAVFVAATVSRPAESVAENFGLQPFIATRPLTGAALIGAKLRTAMWSTLATWALVLAGCAASLTLSGTWPAVTRIAEWLADALGPARAIAVGAFLLLVLMGSTWKQLVQSLYVDMSGREWAIKGTMFATLALLTIGFPLLLWALGSRVAISRLWQALPTILTLLVLLKLALAAFVIRRTSLRGLLTARSLLAGAIAWDAAVFAVFGVLAWTLPSIIVPRYSLLLIAILVVPLARVAAAPLAVAGNRHR